MAPDDGRVMVKGTIIDPGALVVKNKGRLMVRRLATKSTFAPPKQPVFLKVYKAKQLFKEARIACNRFYPDWIAVACFRNTNSISIIGAADNTGRIHFGAIQQLIPDSMDRLSLPNVLIEMPKKCVKTTATRERVGTMAIKKGGKTKDTMEGMITRSKSKIGVEKIRVASAVGSGKQSTSEGKITRSERNIVSYLADMTTKKKTVTRRKRNIGNKDVIAGQFNLEEARKETVTIRKIKTVSYLADKTTKKKKTRGRKRKIVSVLDANTSRNSNGLGKTYLAKKRILNGKKAFTTKNAIKTRSDTNADDNEDVNALDDVEESVPQDFPNLNYRKSNTSDDSLDFHENKELFPDISCSGFCQPAKQKLLVKTSRKRTPVLQDKRIPRTFKPLKIGLPKKDQHGNLYYPYEMRFLFRNPSNKSLCLPAPMESQEQEKAFPHKKKPLRLGLPKKDLLGNTHLPHGTKKICRSPLTRRLSLLPLKNSQEKEKAFPLKKKPPKLRRPKKDRQEKKDMKSVDSDFNYRTSLCPSRHSDVDLDNPESPFSGSNESISDASSLEKNSSSKSNSWERPSTSSKSFGLPAYIESEKNENVESADSENIHSSRNTNWELLSTSSDRIGFLATRESQKKEDLKSDDLDFNYSTSGFPGVSSKNVDLDNPVSPFSDESNSNNFTLKKIPSSKNTSWEQTAPIEPEEKKDLELVGAKKNPYSREASWEIPSTSHEIIGLTASGESQVMEDCESVYSDTVWVETNEAYYEEGFVESWTETAEEKEKREKDRYNQDVIDRFMESIANMKFW